MRPHTHRPVAVAAVACALSGALLGCGNAGEDRLLGVTGTAVVSGFVVFDVNGNRAMDGQDDSVRNVRIRLLAKGSGDSVAGAVSPPSGFYKMSNVPIGSYLVVVDTAPFADTTRVERLDSTEITLTPGDSTVVHVLISYPHITVDSARSLPTGRRVFLEGVAHNAPFAFRDTTLHVQDGSGAIRATRLRQVASLNVGPGDSVRLRGTSCLSCAGRNGQPVLDDVTLFPLGQVQEPPAQLLTTLVASTAQGGARDAQFVRLDSATISDTLFVGPPQPNSDLRLTVNDGSGPLEVLLERPSFPAGFPATYAPGNAFDIIGVLVPTTTPGLWRLKPRSGSDLVLQ